ncbi:hypothetical protein IscW_ISCW009920 [Ixodes scapularis]|uniref:Uncharacterized protein n=1 Tax=Ixodes scapularis TaxID=6945 RepID=B7Q3D4_IXOSC|nr:hypothetical protein IscW_ISCW009920 [Ixodes scapularis]|eukprot:XP_002411232.1 hypothetical protein IscW_ISCW009920 [Ixodes scapularis]
MPFMQYSFLYIHESGQLEHQTTAGVPINSKYTRIDRSFQHSGSETRGFACFIGC